MLQCGHLIIGLLQKDPSLRLGSDHLDGQAIMQHPWFEKTTTKYGVMPPLDWELLYHKQLDVPWKPDISSETDTKYFNEEFTQDDCALTPDELMNKDLLRNAKANNIKVDMRAYSADPDWVAQNSKPIE